MLSFEMLNFYAFWSLEQGNSTATVSRFYDIGTSGGWGPLNSGGPCALHNLHNMLLRHWSSPSDNPIILVFGEVSSSGNLDRITPSDAIKHGGIGKSDD